MFVHLDGRICSLLFCLQIRSGESYVAHLSNMYLYYSVVDRATQPFSLRVLTFEIK